MDLGYLRLHIKTLASPRISVETMFASLHQIYAAARIQAALVSTEVLELPQLQDLHVGSCDSTITAEQSQLFANRNHALPNDVVAYAVRCIVPPSEGCATHPQDRPSVVLAQTA